MSDFLTITNTMNKKNPTVLQSGNNKYYVFDTPGTYTIQLKDTQITDLSYLVVGGGGGSSGTFGANGGQIQYGSLSLSVCLSVSLSLSHTHTHTHTHTHSLLGCRIRFVVCVVCACVRAGSSLPWPSI
jgi:hypothetical protein